MSTPQYNLGRRLDLFALLAVQPLIAAVSIIGLKASPETASELAKPVFIWGGVVLLGFTFVEGVWSFARRRTGRQTVATLWLKLIGAGLCAILAFASAYKHLGLIDNGQISHKTGAALYFSVTTWSTIGFGDVVATVHARPFAAAQAMLGLAFNSALIGLILHATTNRRPAEDGRGETPSL